MRSYCIALIAFFIFFARNSCMLPPMYANDFEVISVDTSASASESAQYNNKFDGSQSEASYSDNGSAASNSNSSIYAHVSNAASKPGNSTSTTSNLQKSKNDEHTAAAPVVLTGGAPMTSGDPSLRGPISKQPPLPVSPPTAMTPPTKKKNSSRGLPPGLATTIGGIAIAGGLITGVVLATTLGHGGSGSGAAAGYYPYIPNSAPLINTAPQSTFVMSQPLPGIPQAGLPSGGAFGNLTPVSQNAAWLPRCQGYPPYDINGGSFCTNNNSPFLGFNNLACNTMNPGKHKRHSKFWY